MKYEEGDEVKVRNDLIVGQMYGKDSFVEDMIKLKGKIVTIKCKFEREKGYFIVEDYERWCWTEEMFEGGYTQLTIE